MILRCTVHDITTHLCMNHISSFANRKKQIVTVDLTSKGHFFSNLKYASAAIHLQESVCMLPHFHASVAEPFHFSSAIDGGAACTTCVGQIQHAWRAPSLDQWRLAACLCAS